MMDNHLNNLMKYLDSIALIISIPALISGIWGMNVGGLPGKENELGFLWVTFIWGYLSHYFSFTFAKKELSKIILPMLLTYNNQFLDFKYGY